MIWEGICTKLTIAVDDHRDLRSTSADKHMDYNNSIKNKILTLIFVAYECISIMMFKRKFSKIQKKFPANKIPLSNHSVFTWSDELHIHIINIWAFSCLNNSCKNTYCLTKGKEDVQNLIQSQNIEATINAPGSKRLSDTSKNLPKKITFNWYAWWG